MFKKPLIIFSILLIFILGCSNGKDILTYENKELGISFNYPKDFKIYQTDKDTIKIDTGYENLQASLMEISIGIRKIDKQLITDEQIKFRLQGQPIISRVNKGNYELIRFGKGSQYYILSEKGTFYVGDTLDTWKEKFEEEGIYQEYRAQLDQIRDSIRII